MSDSLFSKSPLAEAFAATDPLRMLSASRMCPRQWRPGKAAQVLWCYGARPAQAKPRLPVSWVKRQGRDLLRMSAVFDGVAELRRVFASAEKDFQAGQQTLLFIDEIHRFNKAQQDALVACP